jgi:hypothetical protein
MGALAVQQRTSEAHAVPGTAPRTAKRRGDPIGAVHEMYGLPYSTSAQMAAMRQSR